MPTEPGETVLVEPAQRLLSYLTQFAKRVEEGEQIDPEEVEKATRASRLFKNLMTYGVKPGPGIPRRKLEAGRDALAQLISPDKAGRAFDRAGEYSVGRAAVRRHVAAAALEAKLADSSLKRTELTERFCPCGRARHGEDCDERLRRDVRWLNKLIRAILREYPA